MEAARRTSGCREFKVWGFGFAGKGFLRQRYVPFATQQLLVKRAACSQLPGSEEEGK